MSQDFLNLPKSRVTGQEIYKQKDSFEIVNRHHGERTGEVRSAFGGIAYEQIKTTRSSYRGR